MKRIIALGLVLALAGCLSPEQIEARRQQECANMGAPPGSPDYFTCRFVGEQLRQARIDQALQAMQNAADYATPNRYTLQQPTVIVWR